MNTDPAARMAEVREKFAAEQAKLTGVDKNGNPIPPAAPQPAPTGVPAPNPALGSSASGGPDLTTRLEAAQKAGDWKTVLQLLHGQPRPDNAA